METQSPALSIRVLTLSGGCTSPDAKKGLGFRVWVSGLGFRV